MKKTIAAFAVLLIASGSAYAEGVTFLEQQSQNEVLGTDFIGTSVVTKDGQKIGSISNLVFDSTGHIELAIIGVGGFLGVAQKEVAVSFDSLVSDEQNGKHVLLIDATKDQLKAAPTYKTLNDQAMKERIAKWRQKASESWAQVKEKAGKAYEEGKEKAGKAYEEAKDRVQK